MKKNKQTKERRKKLMIGIFGVILLVSSLGGVVLYGNNNPQSNKITLNISNKNYEFTRNQQNSLVYYSLDIDNKKVNFYYLPYEVEYINISPEIVDSIKESNQLYLTFNPEDQESLRFIDLVRFDLSETLSNKYLINGILEKNNELYRLPYLNCENATEFTPVIKFIESNTTEVFKKDNCINIKSRAAGFIKIRDKIIYSLYGVF